MHFLRCIVMFCRRWRQIFISRSASEGGVPTAIHCEQISKKKQKKTYIEASLLIVEQVPNPISSMFCIWNFFDWTNDKFQEENNRKIFAVLKSFQLFIWHALNYTVILSVICSIVILKWSELRRMEFITFMGWWSFSLSFSSRFD